MVGKTRTGLLMLIPRFSPRKRSQPDLCADPREVWVQQLMQYLDTSPAPQKSVQRCKKDKKDKSNKKKKGCKR